MPSAVRGANPNREMTSTGVILSKKGETLGLSSLLRDEANGERPTKIYIRTGSKQVFTSARPAGNIYKIDNRGVFYDGMKAATEGSSYVPLRVPDEVLGNGKVTVGKRFKFMCGGKMVRTGRVVEIVALSDRISHEGDAGSVATNAPTEFIWLLTMGLSRSRGA